MRFLDVGSDPQITSLTELIGSLSGAADMTEALVALASDLRAGGRPAACVIVSSTGRGSGGPGYGLVRVVTDEGNDLPVEPSAVRHGGLIAELIRWPQPKVVHAVDLAADTVLPRELQRYRCAMAVPLFVEQELRHWVVLLHRQEDAFGAAELRELMLRSNLVAAVAGNVETARQLVAANLKIQADIDAIAEIQQALLPAAVPEDVPGLRLAASYQAAQSAGGDLYDFVALGREQTPGGTTQESDLRWAFLIGDVSGHGPAAAVVMAMLHSILHAYPVRPEGPAEVLQHANRHLCSKRVGGSFVTAFLAFYDPGTRLLTYARAGHNPPLLFGEQGRPPHVLEAVGDLPLGIDPEKSFAQASVPLERGQMLILYTDGITEARRPGGELFGTHRLQAALSPRPVDPLLAVRRIKQAVLAHTAGAALADDQTLIAVQVD
jgi:sigma-B regulation protein RsbU (phosphoserine phosphatase)